VHGRPERKAVVATAASVLVCALELLAGTTRTLAPIHLVDAIPVDASSGVEGFVRFDPPAIYLVTSTPAFRAAAAADGRCGNLMALRKIASIIVHEQWHLRHGADEGGAYQAQLMALARLNAGPGTLVYQGVARSMRHVLSIQKRLDAAAARRPAPPLLTARVDAIDRGH
jgi:hypothetical protein